MQPDVASKLNIRTQHFSIYSYCKVGHRTKKNPTNIQCIGQKDKSTFKAFINLGTRLMCICDDENYISNLVNNFLPLKYHSKEAHFTKTVEFF